MARREHKRIYALVIYQEPGSKQVWTDPRTDIEYRWTVPHDGMVLCYVGETTMTLQERESKHHTFSKKYALWMFGHEVLDVHDYPIYRFLYDICGASEFSAIELQAAGEEGLSESQWIAEAQQLGHPLMNKMKGSHFLRKGQRQISVKDLGLGVYFKKPEKIMMDPAESRRLAAEYYARKDPIGMPKDKQ